MKKALSSLDQPGLFGKEDDAEDEGKDNRDSENDEEIASALDADAAAAKKPTPQDILEDHVGGGNEKNPAPRDTSASDMAEG